MTERDLQIIERAKGLTFEDDWAPLEREAETEECRRELNRMQCNIYNYRECKFSF